MVLNQAFPPVNRVEKEALSLINNGLEVVLLCLRHNKKEALYEDYKGIKIHRVFINKKVFDILSALYLILPFYRLFMKRKIKKYLRKNKIGALHIHNLPLADVGIKLREKYKFKLVCDQHEYYSNWIVRAAHYNTRIGKIVKYFSNWKKYERKFLSKADLVITIEKPLMQEYIDKVNVDPEKIISLPNTPRNSVFNNDNVDPAIVKKYENNFILFYAGGITILKGINIVIHALPKLKEKIPNIKLVLGGKIHKYINPIEEAKNIGVDDFIEFVGWINIDQLPSYIYSSDICFHVPPVYNEEVNRTIQTKIYQYLKMGKPIIVGQAKMAREFVEKNQLGFSIQENNSEDFAEKVLKLYKNPELYNKIANNCSTIGKYYSWEKTILSLVNYYKNSI